MHLVNQEKEKDYTLPRGDNNQQQSTWTADPARKWKKGKKAKMSNTNQTDRQQQDFCVCVVMTANKAFLWPKTWTETKSSFSTDVGRIDRNAAAIRQSEMPTIYFSLRVLCSKSVWDQCTHMYTCTFYFTTTTMIMASMPHTHQFLKLFNHV